MSEAKMKEEIEEQTEEAQVPNPLNGKIESDAEEAVAAIDDQHKEVMQHIMNNGITAIVKVEAEAAAIVAACMLNPNIHEDKDALTAKILNSHRQVEARALLTAASALLRLSGVTVTAKDVQVYDGLADALVRDNMLNFKDSFDKSVDDTLEKMKDEGKPEIAVVAENSSGLSQEIKG